MGNSNVVGGVAAAVSLAAAAITAWPRRSNFATKDQHDEVLELLARETLNFWTVQAKEQGITTPVPAAVRWSWGDQEIAASAKEVSSSVLSSGVITNLRSDLYDPPTGPTRIALLGEAGAGKTSAMMLLLIDILENRPTSSDRPVPVWITLGGWDVLTTPLLSWATNCIDRDYLNGSRNGDQHIVSNLIRDGRIALFLDGLDEMPDRLRGLALEAIDRQAALKVVLTSRTEEYRAALLQGRLWKTAVVELRPVSIDDAGAFLLAEQLGKRRASWQDFVDHLKKNRESEIAQCLTSPLMLSLVRHAYAKVEPEGLLGFAKGRSRQEIQQHLLGRLLVTNFPGQPERKRSIGALAAIAGAMGTSRDLHWWDIPTWRLGARPLPWVFLSVPIGTALGLTFASLFGMLDYRPQHDHSFVLSYLLVVLVALGGGWEIRPKHRQVAFAWAQKESTIFRPGIRNAWLRVARNVINSFEVRDGPIRVVPRWPEWKTIGAMLRYGMASAGLSAVPLVHQFGLTAGFILSAIFGGTVGVVTKLLAFWKSPLATAHIVSPMHIYLSDRRGSLLGVLIGLLVGGFLGGIMGGAFGLVFGSVIGMTSGLMTVSGLTIEMTMSEWLIGRRPSRPPMIKVLLAAEEKRILRKVGAIYQFRHAALQDLLADDARAIALADEPVN